MNRKITLLTFILTLISLTGFSQKTVYAEDIMNDIKAGKDISISNATIKGILDFTYMDEQLENQPRKRASRKRNNTIKYKVASKVSFTNCTFRNHVLAYIPDGDNTGYTFIADFEDDVVFKDCMFERKAMFKHSIFVGSTSFEGSTFDAGTTFKHAAFNEEANFKNTVFESNTTFKHAIFKEMVQFNESIFHENVTLKHTTFRNGVSFQNVQFKGSLDMKHTMIKGKFNMTGMKVSDDIDSKHTVINGKSFTTYLLNNK
jgi:hypothetical protein